MVLEAWTQATGPEAQAQFRQGRCTQHPPGCLPRHIRQDSSARLDASSLPLLLDWELLRAGVLLASSL